SINGAYDNTIVVPNGTIQTLAVPAGLLQTNNDLLVENDKGLLLTSDVPISVLYRINGTYNKVLITGKNSEGLGTSFVAGSQTNVSPADPRTSGTDEAHFVSVLATEDNTEVIFRFDNPIDDGAGGFLVSPHTVNLNRGQS